jgi:hypothetical protein
LAESGLFNGLQAKKLKKVIPDHLVPQGALEARLEGRFSARPAG